MSDANKVAQLRAQEEQRRLSKEELLSVHRHQDVVPIPELGGAVVIQSLTYRERREIREKAKVGTPEYDEDLMETLSIIKSCIDPPLDEKDLERLKDQDSTIIDTLSLAVGFLNMPGRGESSLGKDSRPMENSDSPSESVSD